MTTLNFWRHLVGAIAVVVAIGITAPSPAGSLRRQQQEAGKPKARIDQHWRVVADVAPVDLERQLKLLNSVGVSIDQSQIRLVGEKFVVITSDNDETNSAEEGDTERP